MLSLSGFEKKYPSGFDVVIPKLELNQGIHLILGGNGSGKSTLLKAIAGIHPSKGEILLHGISQSAQPIEYRRKIGFSAAEPTFPEFLNLEDLISLVAKAKRAEKSEIEDLKEILGAKEFASYPLGGYSSGMLKKAALLLAFLGNPDLLILDEPFTTIDAETQDQLTQLILKRASSGIGFLITSHQHSPLDSLPVSSILKMKSGRIEGHG